MPDTTKQRSLFPTAHAAKKPRKQTAPKPPEPQREAEADPIHQHATRQAARQREISISEFFQKNRHLLGFDNAAKALLTTVKEGVDNSLDACEDAQILPDIEVRITQIKEEVFRVSMGDNGPGIVRAQIPKIFGKLLYGSKFHAMKQTRGQQGIGISAAGMYGQLTTGKPIVVRSTTGRGRPTNYYEIHIDTRNNKPEIKKEEEIAWDRDHGTQVEIELEARHVRGQHGVETYLEQTAIANPHARIRYHAPDGVEQVWERTAEVLPVEPLEIKPHPHGLELGAFIDRLKDTDQTTLSGFLRGDFSRIGPALAQKICEGTGLSPRLAPRRIDREQAEKLYRVIAATKIMAPPSRCLSPIGEEKLFQSLNQGFKADFYTSSTRSPAVYRGNPFQVEVGMAYGGNLPGDEPIQVMRFANRVPLQYQKSACAITKAVMATEWRRYGLQQARGALPVGPCILAVHLASVWVPFTSESKEAIAHYPEILKEFHYALLECGRRLASFVNRRRRDAAEAKKRSYIDKYIPHIGIALQEILELSDPRRDQTVEKLRVVLERSRKA